MLGTTLQREKNLLELDCGRENDTFETRLEDAVEFALAEIRRVVRDLGRTTQYKKGKHTHVHLRGAETQCD